MFPGISTNVSLATASTPGLVQIDSSLNVVLGVISSRPGRADIWALSGVYRQGELIIYTDNKVYLANSAISTNTSFATGTSGSTWTLVGSATTITQPSVLKTTATYTISLTDFMVRGSASSQNQIFTLPASATAYVNGVGQIVHVKKVDSSTNTVILQANGSELIDGLNARPALTTQYSTWAVMSNGTGWDVL